jgi:hypothetical protein
VRTLIALPTTVEGQPVPEPDPLAVAAAVEWDQPPGA